MNILYSTSFVAVKVYYDVSYFNILKYNNCCNKNSYYQKNPIKVKLIPNIIYQRIYKIIDNFNNYIL